MYRKSRLKKYFLKVTMQIVQLLKDALNNADDNKETEWRARVRQSHGVEVRHRDLQSCHGKNINDSLLEFPASLSMRVECACSRGKLSIESSRGMVMIVQQNSSSRESKIYIE